MVFLCTFSPVAAASVFRGEKIVDPYGSEALLGQFDFSRPIGEEERKLADQFKIELVTMGKSDPIYVWFGHTALVITDMRNGNSVMYDYGIFSFGENFYWKFIRGRLYYEVWATSAQARYALAQEEDRDVRSMTLDLPPEAKLEMIRFLNFNVQPENNTYLYHLYYQNCSTRIRDIIDHAVGGQFRRWAEGIPSDQTIRQHVMRHTSPYPFMDWVLNYLQSSAIDHPITLWDAMFLPIVLEQAVADFSYTDASGITRPLVKSTKVINTVSAHNSRPPVLDTWQSMTDEAFLAGLAIAVISLILRRNVFSRSPVNRISYGIVSLAWTCITGILALLLLFMMTASDHDVTYWNENIISVNPYLLVMAFQTVGIMRGRETSLSQFRKANSVLAVITVVHIVLKGVFADILIQQNWQILLAMLPIYISNSNLPFERVVLRKRRVIHDEG